MLIIASKLYCGKMPFRKEQFAKVKENN